MLTTLRKFMNVLFHSDYMITEKMRRLECIPTSLRNLREEGEPKFPFLFLIHMIDHTEREEELINKMVEKILTLYILCLIYCITVY